MSTHRSADQPQSRSLTGAVSPASDDRYRDFVEHAGRFGDRVRIETINGSREYEVLSVL